MHAIGLGMHYLHEIPIETAAFKVADDWRCDSQSGDSKALGQACDRLPGGSSGKSTNDDRSLSLVGAKAAPAGGFHWPSGWGRQGLLDCICQCRFNLAKILHDE